MDPRLYMLVATFALLIVALLATIISAVRSGNRRRSIPDEPPNVAYEWPALPPAPSQSLDTDLEGLKLEVPPESPSAALLTPLRTGTWQPPAELAPVALLPEVSLDARIATYQAEPELADGEPLIASRVQPRTAEPVLPPVKIELVPAAPALMPTPALEPVIAVVSPDPLSVVSRPDSAMALSPSVAVERAVDMVASAPQSEHTPMVRPEWRSTVPLVETSVTPATPPADVSRSVSASEVDFADEISALIPPLDVRFEHPAVPDAPPSAPALVLEPAPEPTPSPAPSPESALAPRPAAVVHEPPVPDAVVPLAHAVVPAQQPARPRAVVRTAVPDGGLGSSAVILTPLEAAAPGPAGPAGEPAADLVMVAPIEMWFGDSRVGVKAGTKTYEQFRKYADVLFAELQVSKARNR